MLFCGYQGAGILHIQSHWKLPGVSYVQLPTLGVPGLLPLQQLPVGGAI